MRIFRGMNASRWALAAVLPLLWAAPLPAAASAPCGQVWLLSTREAPLCGDLESGRAAIQYWQLAPDASWQPADAGAFHRSDDAAVPTTIFIHGNRTDAQTAVEHGWCIYQHMLQAAAGRPFRLVIWSWPSERMARHNRADVQMKAEFSDAQSYYLARFLGDMRADVPVSLIGYSFGARTASGALELLAGGSIAGHCLPPAVVVARRQQSRPRPYRVVLVAAASDADWLLPGHRDGEALSLVERMLVTRNESDRVLKWYRRLYGPGGPEALGYVGPLCTAQPGSCERIDAIDVACSVGHKHDWYRYQAAPELVERLGWYTFLTDAGR